MMLGNLAAWLGSDALEAPAVERMRINYYYETSLNVWLQLTSWLFAFGLAPMNLLTFSISPLLLRVHNH
jgi:hypothetical protein